MLPLLPPEALIQYVQNNISIFQFKSCSNFLQLFSLNEKSGLTVLNVKLLLKMKFLIIVNRKYQCCTRSTGVTKEVLSICTNLKTIELGLPVPNSENVKAFSEQVGPENSTKKVPGCYYIYSPNHPELGTYVRHSIHLGKRVKDHAKGVQNSTGKLVQAAGFNAMVRVYIPDPSLLPSHITMARHTAF